MPQSMTGFAAVDLAAGPIQLTWELRSVNHRYLDVSFRLPEELRRLEPDLRKLAAASVRRGKLECSLRLTPSEPGERRFELDMAVVAELEALQAALKSALPDAAPLSIGEALRWPGVLEEPERRLSELAEPAREGLARALDELQRARGSEGERIAELLEQRNRAILALVEELRPSLAGIEARQREKYRERLERLDIEAQPERLEQELAIVAQRLDVSEEIDRIAGHVDEIRTVLAGAQPGGRKLDFLIQELNREANTLASKSQDEGMTRCAVELKVLVEQMREQVQNLE